MANYVVTGTAGFIGSRVAEYLLHEGHHVCGVDNLNDSCDLRLKHWRVEQLRRHPAFQFELLDVADRAAVEQLVHELERAEAVFHLAARAGVRPSVSDPWIYYESNLLGTLNVLEWCRQKAIPKLILASTSSVYGDPSQAPFSEEFDTDHPLSPYAASKKAAENLSYSYHHLHGLDVTVFRYFTVYGPAGRPDMSPFRFVQWIAEGRPLTLFGDGTQSRDFTYVDDIARGTVLGLKPVGFEVFNLGNDSPVMLMDFIRMLEEKLGRKAQVTRRPRHAADVSRTWAKIDKARSMLGWEPQTPLSSGLNQLISWYRRERSWASQVRTD